MTAASIDLAAPRGAASRILAVAAITLTLVSVAALARLAMAPGRVGISAHIPPLWLAVHLVCVVPAVPLGGYLLLRRKGDAVHKRLGRIWAVLMIGAALSSFALKGLAGGSFSPIHLLSILTLVSIPRAIWNIRRGNVAGHKRSMTILYVSLIAAGAFAFLPGRLMGEWLFG